jgi:replication factor C subunit 1
LCFNQQAAALGTKILDEDGLLDLIRTMPGKRSKYEMAAEAEVGKANWSIEVGV